MESQAEHKAQNKAEEAQNHQGLLDPKDNFGRLLKRVSPVFHGYRSHFQKATL